MSRSRLRSLFVGLGLGLATAISVAIAAPPTKVGDLQVNGSASITGSAYVGNTVTIAGGPKWSAGASAPVGACVTGSMYSLTSNVSPGFYVCSASAWVSVAGGTLTGSGTSGDLAAWTSGSTLGNYAGSACGAGSGVIAVSATGAVTCGILGITNSAANHVIPVSDGTNLGSSSATDDGTTFAINTSKLTVTEASGNTFVAGTFTGSGAATFRSTETVWGNWSGSGNVSLGDAAADQIAFNGSASTTLDMNSHKILDVTNGTAAQDAAAFGQIATAVNAAVNGTATAIARFTGTHALGNSAVFDDGTSFYVTGGSVFLVNETSGNTAVGGTLTTTGADVDKSTLTVWGAFNGSGNVSLGDAASDAIAFNGSASTALDMNSHKVVDVTDPTAQQDAVTLHYLNVNGYTSTSGMTAGRSVRAITSSTIGIGAFTDDGTNATTNGNLTSTAGTTTVANFAGLAITPSLTGGATVNDWAPTGYAGALTIFVSCPSTTCTLTGLQGGRDGRKITLFNTGAGELDIPNNSGSSTSGNRFNNSDFGGVVILVANAGCAVNYTYSTADNFWHQTAKSCDPVIQQTTSAITVSVPANMKNVAANGWVDATGTGYFGGDTAGAYIGTGGGTTLGELGFGYGTNSAFTGCINCTGYAESTTQARSLWIQDGQGSASTHSIVEFDGAAKTSTFGGKVIASAGNQLGSGAVGGTLDDTGGFLALETAGHATNVGGTLRVNNNAQFDTATTYPSTTAAHTFTNQPQGAMGAVTGTTIELFDDFFYGFQSTFGTGQTFGNWEGLISGTGTNIQNASNSAGTGGSDRHPGQLSLQYSSGSTNGNYAVIAQAGTIDPHDFTSLNWESSLFWANLSGASAGSSSTYRDTMGWNDAPTTGNAVNGCYFAYDKPNSLTSGPNASNVDALECWCSNGSTRTKYLINNTGNSDESFPLGVGTVAATTWYHLAIVFTVGTRAEFYRNGTKVCDINTNLPTTNSFLMPSYSIITTQTSVPANRAMLIDYYHELRTLTSPRSP